jgi:diguanylate cyclase (GGDEF)-like protein/PAS domain S-box-containing protein
LTNELFREIVSHSSQAVLVVDVSRSEFRIVFANRAYEELSGFTASELEGTAWLEYAATDAAAPEFVTLTRMVESGEAGSLDFPFFGRDGEIWAADLKLIPLESQKAKGSFMLVEHAVKAYDASGRPDSVGQAMQSLASLERTDPVTGLLSNTEFRLLLKRELAIARRGGLPLQLMLFSIPELEIYRQTFGAAAGDSCVRMIGAQIAGTFRRASDLSARVGAATLAVSVTGQDREEVLGLVAQVERKSRNLGLHNPRGQLGRYVVVRGVTVPADPASDDVDGLMARAEAALYARCEGRSRAAPTFV